MVGQRAASRAGRERCRHIDDPLTGAQRSTEAARVTDDTHEDTYRAFQDAVNMTPAALDKWLAGDDSKAVGYVDGANKSDPGGKESIGHESGRHIVDIKRKKKTDLDDRDFAHMKKVVSYVHRHLAQKPSGDIEHSRWRYSLMNWGHDPLQK